MFKVRIDQRVLSWLILVTVVQPMLAVGPLADRATADAAPLAAKFGSDFNGDGLADLAMYLTGGEGAEAVVALYGSKTGLEDADRQRIVAADLGGGTLGETMTSGDFDGDGYADLALGDVNARVGQADEAGAVRIVYGSAADSTSVGPSVGPRTVRGSPARPRRMTGSAGLWWPGTSAADLKTTWRSPPGVRARVDWTGPAR